jgi:UPF0755 protein
MLTRKDKQVIVAAVVLFLVGQTAIFASIPLDTSAESRPVVVKKGTHLRDVANMLTQEDLVRSSWLFTLYSAVAHRGRIIAGEYDLTRDLSIAEIAGKMASGQRKVYVLKIVEGYNLQGVAESLQKGGIMDAAAFSQLAGKAEFLSGLGITEASLEGYLWPDTYYFSKETDVDVFLEKIIRRTLVFFEKEEVKKRMGELHLTMHDVLTLASMIEKEAKVEEEKPLISAVFHNRLALGMSLDSDPTVMYGLGMHPKPLTKADLNTATAYNTYRLRGLPKGPICSPSRSSLLAALQPAQSDMLYFVSRNDGTHVFSRRMEEHDRYVTTYQRSKKKKP